MLREAGRARASFLTHSLRVAPLAAAVLAVGQACSRDGSDGGGAVAVPSTSEEVLRWNGIAVDTSGLDHMPDTQGPPHTFGQQVGPCRSARAMAIVHIAMFESLIAIDGGYQTYIGLGPAGPGEISRPAAVAQAGHDTLVALFPSQAALLDDALAQDLARIPDGAGETAGVALGQLAASTILTMRSADGSAHPEPVVNVDFFCSDQPGFWRQDPISQHPLALGGQWSHVMPFAMASVDQFRAPAPPVIGNEEYAAAYDAVLALGGDGIVTPTTRTPEQTTIGIYWAYDGTPSLCAPPRLYNQITVLIGEQQGADATQMARLLALANVAMADAGIACWESKYFYEYWRPVAGIRESDPGSGPSGLGDGNPFTVGDPTWTPLGAPASNTTGPNFTPPFPAYPSGHATFGGALFQTLRRIYGTDAIPFTFVSDEYNGVTLDNQGLVRPLVPRTFQTLSQAEEENGQSRIYLGIHWAFDKTAGIAQGNAVADWVFDHMYPTAP